MAKARGPIKSKIPPSPPGTRGKVKTLSVITKRRLVRDTKQLIKLGAPTKARHGGGSIGPRIDSPHGAITPLIIEGFLHMLAACANVTQVCDELRINRLTIYHMKNSDPEFLKRFNIAMATGYDSWEDEIARRAFKGIQNPVYQQGIKVGEVTAYSDVLAQMLVRGAKPERYREKSATEVNIKGIGVVKLETLSDDELNEAINSKLTHMGAIGSMERSAVLKEAKAAGTIT